MARRRTQRQIPAPQLDPAKRVRAELIEVGDKLARLDRQRADLLAERDRLVDEGRQLGLSWPVMGSAVGVTHQALLLRHQRVTGRGAAAAPPATR